MQITKQDLLKLLTKEQKWALGDLAVEYRVGTIDLRPVLVDNEVRVEYRHPKLGWLRAKLVTDRYVRAELTN